MHRTNIFKYNIIGNFVLFFQVIPQRIPEKLSKYLKEVDFPKCGLTEIPIELGRTSVERINFEFNELGDTSFMWLEELPIRKSLKSLNLAENKVSVFAMEVSRARAETRMTPNL